MTEIKYYDGAKILDRTSLLKYEEQFEVQYYVLDCFEKIKAYRIIFGEMPTPAKIKGMYRYYVTHDFIRLCMTRLSKCRFIDWLDNQAFKKQDFYYTPVKAIHDVDFSRFKKARIGNIVDGKYFKFDEPIPEKYTVDEVGDNAWYTLDHGFVRVQGELDIFGTPVSVYGIKVCRREQFTNETMCLIVENGKAKVIKAGPDYIRLYKDVLEYVGYIESLRFVETKVYELPSEVEQERKIFTHLRYSE